MAREKIEGLEFVNKNGCKFKVLNFIRWDKVNGSLYNVEFESGHKVEAYQKSIKNLTVKDVYFKHIYDVACIGNAPYKNNENIYSVWVGMIRRCYEKDKDGSYVKYGARGITVCDRWLCFEYFLEDFKLIDGYGDELFKEGKLQLDKDFKNHNAKEYSFDNCCWISKSLNCKLQIDTGQKDVWIEMDGLYYVFSSIRETCRKFNIDSGNVSKLLNGKIKSYKKLNIGFYDLNCDFDFIDCRIVPDSHD